MTQYKVDYYVKPLGATRITKLGGSWGEKTEQQIMNEISAKINQYYVSVSGHTAFIEIEHVAQGHPYLKTVPDNTRLDNLLALPRHYF